MKNRWTLSIAAIALVVSVFPAFANQSDPFAPKSSDQKKVERKIDGAAATPYVTKHQAKTLKNVASSGEKSKADEQVAYPSNPGQPGSLPGTTGEGSPEPGTPDGNPAPQNGEAEAPKPEEKKPAYRLQGTVCGKGPALAVFDQGGEWPSMLKAGDKLDEFTTVISIEGGKVTLEKVVSPAQPAVEAQVSPDGRSVLPGRPAQPEKRERFELYTW